MDVEAVRQKLQQLEAKEKHFQRLWNDLEQAHQNRGVRRDQAMLMMTNALAEMRSKLSRGQNLEDRFKALEV